MEKLKNYFWLFAAVGVAVLFMLGFSGCASTVPLRAAIRESYEAQADIVGGLNGLDAACQAAQRDPAGLDACRTPRDRARVSK